MRRTICVLLIVCCIFGCANTIALAENSDSQSMNEYTISEMNYLIAIPQTHMVLMQNTEENSALLSIFGISKTDWKQLSQEQNMYLYALEKNFNDEITVTFEDGPIEDLAQIPDRTIDAIIGQLETVYENQGFELDSYELYQNGRMKFIKQLIKIEGSNEPSYIKYSTYYNWKRINITFTAYSGSLTRNDETIMKDIADSLIYLGNSGNVTRAEETKSKLLIVTERGETTYFSDGYMLENDDYLMMITTLEDGTIEIESFFLYGAESWDQCTLVIPATLYGRTVSSFDDKAFHYSPFASIIIPETVVSLGERVFEDCRNLTSIEIPEGVTSINAGAFFGCESLTSIIIPDTVSSIGDDVFHDCESLTTVTIPNGVSHIGKNAFHGCKNLVSIRIPDGVTSINEQTFARCESLESVVIPETVVVIDQGAFYYCTSLATIKLPKSLELIGDSAFYGCEKLNSITIPAKVASIGSWAFAYCNISYVKIPENVVLIGDSAFESCDLRSVAIPNSVLSVGANPFKGCFGLKRIIVSSDHPTLEIINGALFDKNKKKLICYPRGLSSSNYSIPDGTREVGDAAFMSCTGLESITIPDGVVSLGWHAFSWNHSLRSISIPDSVISIEDHAFYECPNLSAIVNHGSYAAQYFAEQGIAFTYSD